MFIHLATYFQELQSKLRAMSAPSAFAVALAAIERRWSAFERAASEAKEVKVELAPFRHVVDRAWMNLRMQVPLPHSFWFACKQAVPANTGTPVSQLCQTIAFSFVEFARSLEEGKQEHAYRVCVQNFDLLELLLKQHGMSPNDLSANAANDSDELRRIRLLVESEVRRQTITFHRLGPMSSASLLEATRRESVGVNLYGDEWFKTEIYQE